MSQRTVVDGVANLDAHAADKIRVDLVLTADEGFADDPVEGFHLFIGEGFSTGDLDFELLELIHVQNITLLHNYQILNLFNVPLNELLPCVGKFIKLKNLIRKVGHTADGFSAHTLKHVAAELVLLSSSAIGDLFGIPFGGLCGSGERPFGLFLRLSNDPADQLAVALIVTLQVGVAFFCFFPGGISTLEIVHDSVATALERLLDHVSAEEPESPYQYEKVYEQTYSGLSIHMMHL